MANYSCKKFPPRPNA